MNAPQRRMGRANDPSETRLLNPQHLSRDFATGESHVFWSQEAEQAVLGALLLDNTALGRAQPLAPCHFFHPPHADIFHAIASMIGEGKPADVITVFEQLQCLGKAEECGGILYLNSLAQSVPSAANMRRYAEIVRERATLRRLREVSTVADARALLADQHEHDAPAWAETLKRWNPPTNLLTREVRVEFAVDGLIQAGKVGALVAAGGTSKTSLLLQLGICHALGRDFLGRAVERGTFVLLSPDDTQADLDGALTLMARALKLTPDEADTVALKCRLISLQGASGCRTFTTTVRGDVLATGLEATIARACVGVDDLVGIALDTLRQFAGGSSNDEQVIKLTIGAATELAGATGAYVVLPHHTGKQNFRDGVTDLYCGSGSAAIADNCRFLLLLQTATWADVEQSVRRTGLEDGDPLVLRSTRGSLLVRSSEPIFLCRSGFRFDAIEGSVMSSGQQADQRDRDVLAAVRAGAVTKNAVCAAVKGKRTAVMCRIDELTARGHLAGSQSGSRNSAQLVLTASGGRLLDATF